MIGERRPRPRARAFCIRAIASATLGGGGDFAIPDDLSRRAYGFVNAGFAAGCPSDKWRGSVWHKHGATTSYAADQRGGKAELSAKPEVEGSLTDHCMGKPMPLRWRASKEKR